MDVSSGSTILTFRRHVTVLYYRVSRTRQTVECACGRFVARFGVFKSHSNVKQRVQMTCLRCVCASELLLRKTIPMINEDGQEGDIEILCDIQFLL
jgi:hypothetical protein